MVSVRSKNTETFFPELFWLASIYMNGSPMGCKDVAPDWDVGLVVFVDFIKFVIFPILFLSLQIIFQYGRRYSPVLPALLIVVSVICILS